MNRPEPTTPINRRQKRRAPAGTRQHGHRRCLLLALAAFSSALAVAACGGSSKPKTASSSSKSSAQTPGLAFSKCMRSHGVPNFPDPNTGAGFQVHVSGTLNSVNIGDIPGINQQSPAYLAAYSACKKLLPQIGPGFGQQHPSAAAIAQAREWSKCMRAHGVPNWPDPQTYLPNIPNPAAQGLAAVISINSAVFLIPLSINPDAPAFVLAAKTCELPYGQGLGR
jgi:hypothetical protein